MPGRLIAILPALIFGALVAGSLVYCVLQVIGTRCYRSIHPAPATSRSRFQSLKPLDGLDDGLETNLRTFFKQDYEGFEILFAARRDDDPGLELARRLSREYPLTPARFFCHRRSALAQRQGVEPGVDDARGSKRPAADERQ